MRTRAPILLALLALLQGSRGAAEEYDVTITFGDSSPVAVPFYRCSINSEVTAIDEAPAGCKDRETKFFSVTAARVTNLGGSIVWIHVGRAKLPILPGTYYRYMLPERGSFNRVYLSGEPGSTVHVFAANPIQDEFDPPRPAVSPTPRSR